MKKKFSIALMLILFVSMLLTACGKPTAEECAEMIANMEMKKFEKEGCTEVMAGELEKLFK